MKIGIDFGTCFSSVAYMNGTEVKGDLLDQEHGKGIPTLFMYSKKRGEVYGYACRGAQNDSDVIRYIKTIIRENPNDLDKSIQSGGKNYKIRDIVKKYLTFLLNLAENKTVEYGLNDTKIESVTITAPVGIDNGKMAATDYNELMKETVMEITGLDCDHVYVLEEPVAAAISYLYGRNVDMKYGKNQAVLVFDLGGGTLDVSVVEHDQASDEYSIKVKEGDLTLGGNAWDEAFEKYILNKLGLDHTALSSLDKIPFREEVTSTKEKLSGTEVARFIGEVDNDLKLTKVTRQEFDQCTKHLLDRAMGVVKKALSSYGYDVDKFVLVGGSSYMPQIKERIKSEFHLDDSEICLHEPANAISRGAAVYTYMKEYGTRIINTASHTYGFDSRRREDGKDMIYNLLFKGTPFDANGKIFVKSDTSFKAIRDTQTEIKWTVYESDAEEGVGEYANWMEYGSSESKNGMEVIIQIPPEYLGKARSYSTWVAFSLSSDGILEMIITDEKGNRIGYSVKQI